MALGFKLGRMLYLRFADTVALAKFGNLLFYILVVFLRSVWQNAIRDLWHLSPCFRTVFSGVRADV